MAVAFHSALPRIRTAMACPLVRGFSAFGSAELANRTIRIITTVVIARQLAPEIVGEAALALTLFELVRVLAGIGIGQRIIAAHEDVLAATCNTAHRLFWLWSMVLVVMQLAVAAVLGLVFEQSGAAALLAALSGVYPLMPGGLVQCHLAMREGYHGKLARTAATQAIADHLLTAALLLVWPSPWSVVLPKLLTAPIWLVMTRRNRPWSPQPVAGHVSWRSMVRYGSGILAAEGISALRQQGDNLIIAVTMGSAALGTYYFAFNAGLGIITSLATAFRTVSFPMLCAVQSKSQRNEALRRVILTAAALFLPLVAAQSLLAPYYVPVIFGDQWTFTAPLIAILCLAGPGQLAGMITANWLRAEGQVAKDAGRSLFICTAALGGLYLGTQQGTLLCAVIGLVVGSTLASILTAICILAPQLWGRQSSLVLKETF